MVKPRAITVAEPFAGAGEKVKLSAAFE